MSAALPAVAADPLTPIVYNDRRTTIETRRRLAELRAVASAAVGTVAHDAIVALLIAWGELESGLVDRLSGECDGLSPLARGWRRVAFQVGHALRSSWRGDRAGARGWLRRLECAVAELEGIEHPAEVEVGVHEGYAYYGLYPETYLEAAGRFCRDFGPARAVCIGVRSIGAGLAGVVGAELEGAGCEVHSFTVRPWGHPFDRRLVCAGELESEVRAGAGAHFLVVDEGPGLSGSSFAAVAEWLLALGVPEELIVFFPSWPTDGGGLRSERARRLWPRIRKYTVSFEECWLESGRLGEGLPEGRLRDLSGGGWRSVLYRTAADYPAVHPQHERRKYLVEWAPSVGRADGGEPLLLKFTGLGGYGERRRVIAERLAAAGYSPPVRGARHGFSLSMFCAGEPLHPGVSDDVLLETMARYLAFRRREFPADRDVPIDELLGMIRHNTVVRLGSAALGELEWLDSWRERVEARGVVAIDGRMLPHEWLRTPGGYLKVDGVDHHDDHFFPGCQDIAWDIAGAVVEFGFGGAAERALLERYRALSGDAGVEEVLPFYRVAYLAFRLGYALLAASSLGECGDGRRFAAAARRYRVLLRRASRLSR